MGITKNQRVQRAYAVETQDAIRADEPDEVPEVWDQIWREMDRRDPGSQRVTLRLDTDVVAFFKAMGKGYQPRMNRVLRSYMHHRLAGLVKGPEDEKTEEEQREMAKAQAMADRMLARLGRGPRGAC